MAEYIEREETCKKCVRYGMGETLCADCVVKAAPAADVSPVKHGRWKHFELGYFDLWRCTACGEDWTFEYDPTDADTKVNYCPDCGAKMDGE